MVLKDKQESLRGSKSDALRKYISVKEQRNDLKHELNNLKRILTENGVELELDPVREKWREQMLSTTLKGGASLEYELCATFNQSYDKDSLERELYYAGLTCLPVLHLNGGVADLEFVRGDERILASELKDHRVSTFLVDKWCKLKGPTQAYMKQTEQPGNQKQNQKPVQQQTNKQNNGPNHKR